VRLLTIGIAMGYLSVAALAADPDHPGAQLASVCAACHRLDSDDHTAGISPIAGIEPERLAGMMRAFQLDAQKNDIMHAVSLTLSDDEITAVASYLAALGKAKRP